MRAGVGAMRTIGGARGIYKDVKSAYRWARKRYSRSGNGRGNVTDAEALGGYGGHYAQNIYHKKYKPRLSRRKYYRIRRTRKRFNRKVYRVLNKKYPANTFLSSRLAFSTGVANQQQCLVFNVGSSSFSDVAQTPSSLNTGERNNDLTGVFRSFVESSSAQDRDKMRLKIRTMKWDLEILNTDTIPCDVEIYECLCKKSVLNFSSGIGSALQGLKNTPSTWNTTIYSGNCPDELDENNIAGYNQVTNLTLGWTPFMSQFITKYFTIVNDDRYHLGANDRMNLSKIYPIRRGVFKEQTIAKYAALKGVTRLFIVIWKNRLTSDGTNTNAAIASTDDHKGLAFWEKKHYNFQVLDNSTMKEYYPAYTRKHNTYLSTGSAEQDSSDITAPSTV